MKLTDDQIKNIMQKDISCKTVLVSQEDVNEVIEKHILVGWQLVKKTKINDKYKVTFKKIK